MPSRMNRIEQGKRAGVQEELMLVAHEVNRYLTYVHTPPF
jgi:hypothetical protein